MVMQNKPNTRRWRFSLQYLLFETALWALVGGAWILLSRYPEYVGIEVAVITFYTILGAAIGGLIGRHGVGAILGLAVSPILVCYLHLTNTWGL
jgi:hypothetical protein